jgi:hypothetical protein
MVGSTVEEIEDIPSLTHKIKGMCSGCSESGPCGFRACIPLRASLPVARTGGLFYMWWNTVEVNSDINDVGFQVWSATLWRMDS